jgi:hypothetical protein
VPWGHAAWRVDRRFHDMVSAIHTAVSLTRSVSFCLFNALRFYSQINRDRRPASRPSFSHPTCTRREVRGRTGNSRAQFRYPATAKTACADGSSFRPRLTALEVSTDIRSDLRTNLACHEFRFQAGRCLYPTEMPTKCRQFLRSQPKRRPVIGSLLSPSTESLLSPC